MVAHGTIAFDTLTTSDQVNTGTEKSLDTSYIFNGTPKVWCNHQYTATIQDSFNVSGVTDEGTGSHDTDFTNPMSNATYTALCGAFGTSQQTFGVLRTAATTSYRCNMYGDDGSAEDRDLANLGIGDLG